ncbi:MAG: hypothetical protein N4A46_11025 [Schleiferiaceae bacterium]|jgi:hypothetical protein|nr:hypothetical protein [Schleiferiaceae bacterium]
MKRTAVILLLVIPFLGFSQLSKKQKKSIDKYTETMCTCVNDLMSTLHPKASEVVLLMAEKGEEAAMKEVEAMLGGMSKEEMTKFLEAFTTMEDPAFIAKIEACDDKGSMAEGIKSDIDNMKGDAYTHFMAYMKENSSCDLMRSLYELGVEESQGGE